MEDSNETRENSIKVDMFKINFNMNRAYYS